LGSSLTPPGDEQLVAPLDEVAEADELGTLLDELGEADALDEGEFEGELEAMVVGPQAVAPTTATATIVAISARMADFIPRTS
jgi:hypothetical protein